MKKYFYLQLKRVLKVFPPIFIACAVLCAGLGVFLVGMIESDKNDEKNQKFKIGVVGSTEHSYLDLGITALETLDSTRFAIEIERTDEPTAKKALEKGELAAYVVIPKGFAEAALRGDIMKIKYYTTDSAVGVVSIFKDEVTKTVSDILVDSQRGVYGIAYAISQNLPNVSADNHMNALSIDYVSLILKRSEIYTVSSVGVSEGLSTAGYFLCGILTLFVLLLGIVAAGVFIKKDNTLCRVVSAKGVGAFRQTLSEYFAYFILIFFIVSLVAAATLYLAAKTKMIPDIEWITPSDIPLILIKIIPALAVITSLQFLLFEISKSIVSGVLIQFGTALSLGYISGCLYPIYFFPETVQRMARFLPSGIARVHISNCISNNFNATTLLGLLIYFAVFTVAAFVVRRFKITGRE